MTVVVSRAFITKLLHNHIINIKKKISGEAKDSVIFPFYFLLHKRAKPIHPRKAGIAAADTAGNAGREASAFV
jgi:hypothetical protein